MCIRYEDNAINKPIFSIISNLFVRCLYLPYQGKKIILIIKNYALISALICLYLVILNFFYLSKFFKSFAVVCLRAMPSSGLEPETSPLPRECSTAELQGLKKKWAGLDLNQRRQSQRIYSPPPLTTRAPTRTTRRTYQSTWRSFRRSVPLVGSRYDRVPKEFS